MSSEVAWDRLDSEDTGQQIYSCDNRVRYWPMVRQAERELKPSLHL